jgi:HNH endonuclease
LEPDTVSFLRDYGSVIESLAIGSWFGLPSSTQMRRDCTRRFEELNAERRHVRYRGFLLKLQGDHCFYCQAEAGEMGAVDHVIPWCYVLEDRVWNLVLACKNCNSTKSNQTPADRYIDELINRNKTLLAEIIGGKIAAASQVAVRDLREFITKDIDEHIRTLTANCRADGFGTWRHSHLAPDVAERGDQRV